MPAEIVIVTRHRALVELIRERHPELAGRTVIEHVEHPEQVRGKHVVGVLPMHLAAHAAQVTEIPLDLTAADRGRELGIERLREIAGAPRTYHVRENTYRVPPRAGADLDAYCTRRPGMALTLYAYSMTAEQIDRCASRCPDIALIEVPYLLTPERRAACEAQVRAGLADEIGDGR